MRKLRSIVTLIIDLLIPLMVGTLIGQLTRASVELYNSMPKPALSPPSWVFPVVWATLYLLMGVSFALVKRSQCPIERSALWIYGIQLAVNFVWPLLFFEWGFYLIAFFWLLLLIVLVWRMVRLFHACNPLAGWLQLPYLLWLLFAGYLNLAIYWMSR